MWPRLDREAAGALGEPGSMTARKICCRALASGWLLSVSMTTIAAELPWPTTGWQPAGPVELGLDPAALTALNADIESGKYPLVDSLFVARCGRGAFDRRY